MHVNNMAWPLGMQSKHMRWSIDFIEGDPNVYVLKHTGTHVKVTRLKSPWPTCNQNRGGHWRYVLKGTIMSMYLMYKDTCEGGAFSTHYHIQIIFNIQMEFTSFLFMRRASNLNKMLGIIGAISSIQGIIVWLVKTHDKSCFLNKLNTTMHAIDYYRPFYSLYQNYK